MTSAWRYRARVGNSEWAYLNASEPNDYAKIMRVEQDKNFEFEALYTRKEMVDECISEIEAACNFEDYKREELTVDYGQPRFDLMNTIIQALEALVDG